MATRFAKFMGLAAIVTAAGLGLGSGVAQARPTPSCPLPQMPFCNTVAAHNQIADNFFDRTQSMFGIGEGSRFDHAVDRFFGVK